jgi:hypothetical protein
MAWSCSENAMNRIPPINRLAPVLSLLLLLLVPQHGNAAKVFILAGQSNMEGLGLVSGLSPVSQYVYPKVKMYSSVWGLPAFSFYPVLRPGNPDADSATFGPELGIAQVLTAVYPQDSFIFIKAAWGGTSLNDDWLHGQAYNWFRGIVGSALDSIGTPARDSIAGMIWMQGEQDACFDTMAARYAANLKTFVVDEIRKDFGLPSLPFVYGKIKNDTIAFGVYGWPYGCTVQMEQFRAQSIIPCVRCTDGSADSNATRWNILPDDPASVSNFNWRHYDTHGVLVVGKALGTAMVQLLSGDTAIPGCGKPAESGVVTAPLTSAKRSLAVLRPRVGVPVGRRAGSCYVNCRGQKLALFRKNRGAFGCFVRRGEDERVAP